MTFARTRLPGFWVASSTVTPGEFEHLDDYAYAIDGRGGTYAPTSLITIGGSGLSVTGPSAFSNITAATFNCQIVGTQGAAITQSVLNGGGISGTANGTGTGVSGVGGSAGGIGGGFVGGAGSGRGIYAEGTGTGVGAQIIGGSSASSAATITASSGIGVVVTGATTGATIEGGGAGATITANNGTGCTITAGGSNQIGAIITSTGTGVALQCNNGGIHLNGTQPAATADPGANRAHSTNQCKAWANVTTDGLGGHTIQDAYNVASVSLSAGLITISFARPMASATYAVAITVLRNAPVYYIIPTGGRSATSVAIAVYDVAASALSSLTNALDVSFMVFARQ